MSESNRLTPAQRRSNRISIIFLIVMVLGSIGLDQVTKIMAEENFMVWQSDVSLKRYESKRQLVWEIGKRSSIHDPQSFYLSFSLNYVRNQGAAWGLMSDWNDQYRVPFFHIITLLSVFIIISYLLSTPPRDRLARYSFMLVLSGAMGNFIDRITRGYVVDFLDFRWVIPFPFPINFEIDFFPSYLNYLNFKVAASSWRYNFPNFNWADSVITVGVALLIFDLMVLERRNRQSAFHSTKEPIVSPTSNSTS